MKNKKKKKKKKKKKMRSIEEDGKWGSGTLHKSD